MHICYNMSGVDVILCSYALADTRDIVTIQREIANFWVKKYMSFLLVKKGQTRNL